MSQKEMQQLLMLFVFDQGEIVKPVDCVCDKGQNNWQKNVLFNDSMNNAMCMREAPPNNNQRGIGQIAVRPRPAPQNWSRPGTEQGKIDLQPFTP